MVKRKCKRKQQPFLDSNSNSPLLSSSIPFVLTKLQSCFDFESPAYHHAFGPESSIWLLALFEMFLLLPKITGAPAASVPNTSTGKWTLPFRSLSNAPSMVFRRLRAPIALSSTRFVCA
jgi:hypothetical protein